MDAIPVTHVEIVNGHAVIAGTTIKAKLVASMHIRGGATLDEVMAHYGITRAEVYATLAYYYDNQATIEQSFADAESYVKESGTSAESLIDKLGKKRS